MTAMISSLIKSLLFLYIVQFSKSDVIPERIPIFVAYEAGSDDSRMFLRTELVPVSEALKNMVEVTLIPFGRSTLDLKSHSVECFNGPSECLAHVYTQCVNDIYPEYGSGNNMLFIDLITMLPESLMNSDEAYIKCAELAGFDSMLVQNCVQDESWAFQLQRDAGRATPVYAYQFPWVEVGEELVDVVAGESLWDAICDAAKSDDSDDNDDLLPFCFDEILGKERKFKGIKARDIDIKSNKNTISYLRTVSKHETKPMLE